jgi:hypothetical protein
VLDAVTLHYSYRLPNYEVLLSDVILCNKMLVGDGADERCTALLCDKFQQANCMSAWHVQQLADSIKRS